MDSGDNAAVSYYRIGKIQMTLSEGLDDVKNQPFFVDRLTGAISLNFDPQRGMKGYFDFMVRRTFKQIYFVKMIINYGSLIHRYWRTTPMV